DDLVTGVQTCALPIFGVDDKVRSELAFPLISRGQVVGVLNAESQQADAFSEADVALMSAVGSQLASALEVAQLHDTLKREASHRSEERRVGKEGEAGV